MNELINFELLGAQMRMSREDEETIRRDERQRFVKWLDANFDKYVDYFWHQRSLLVALHDYEENMKGKTE